MSEIHYHFHGRGLGVRADDDAAASLLDEVFGAYRSEGESPAELSVEVVRSETPVPGIGSARLLGTAADGTRFLGQDDGSLRIVAHDIGWARIDPDHRRARVEVLPHASARSWQPAYRLVEPVVVELLKSTGLYPLHAAAVEIDGRAMMICGTSGAGKSTLGLAMALRGAGFLGDDTCYLEPGPDDSSVVVRARWSDLHLTDSTLETLVPAATRVAATRRQGAGKWFLAVSRFPELRPVESVPAGWLVFPRVVDGAESRLVRLKAAQALPRLVKQSLVPSGAAAASAQFDLLARTCESVDCLEIEVGRDLVQATDLLFARARGAEV